MKIDHVRGGCKQEQDENRFKTEIKIEGKLIFECFDAGKDFCCFYTNQIQTFGLKSKRLSPRIAKPEREREKEFRQFFFLKPILLHIYHHF